MLDQLVLESIALEVDAGALPPDAGLAVAVVAGGLVHRVTFGMRERDRRLPITQQTTFDLCSLTKAFTAAGLVMAAEEGRLDLDQPLNASGDRISLADQRIQREVTAADLLSHRSGVTAGDLLWYFGNTKRSLQTLPQLPVVDGAFRRTFIYNNMLYGALGELYPQLTGESWEGRISERLLKPLGMSDTTFGPSVDADQGDVALPYVGARRVPSKDASAIAAAGGMRANLDDMARWLSFWVNGGRASDGQPLIGAPWIARMFEPAVPFENANPALLNGLEWANTNLHYGLGWFIGAHQGRRVAFHPGFIDGFSNVMAVLPDKRVGVVVLSNVNYCSAVGRLVKTLIDAVTTEAIAPTEDARDPLAGHYFHPAYGALTLVRRGSRWSMEYGGQAWPVTWKDELTAEVTATIFGLSIPLPLVFHAPGLTQAVDVPLSLDPRAGVQTFERTS